MSSTGDPITEAWNHQREGQYDSALNAFEKIIRTNPDDIDALYGLGLAQKATGRKEEAATSFNKALELISTGQDAITHEGIAEQDYVRTPEEDRFIMLARMVNQRLAELGS